MEASNLHPEFPFLDTRVVSQLPLESVVDPCWDLAFRDCPEHPEVWEGWAGAANCASLVFPSPQPGPAVEGDVELPLSVLGTFLWERDGWESPGMAVGRHSPTDFMDVLKVQGVHWKWASGGAWGPPRIAPASGRCGWRSPRPPAAPALREDEWERPGGRSSRHSDAGWGSSGKLEQGCWDK